MKFLRKKKAAILFAAFALCAIQSNAATLTGFVGGLPFVGPILTIQNGIQAVAYAVCSIGGMVGLFAAWKHEHSWSGLGAKIVEYGSLAAMCIGFGTFLVAAIPGSMGAVL